MHVLACFAFWLRQPCIQPAPHYGHGAASFFSCKQQQEVAGSQRRSSLQEGKTAKLQSVTGPCRLQAIAEATDVGHVKRQACLRGALRHAVAPRVGLILQQVVARNHQPPGGGPAAAGRQRHIGSCRDGCSSAALQPRGGSGLIKSVPGSAALTLAQQPHPAQSAAPDLPLLLLLRPPPRGTPGA